MAKVNSQKIQLIIVLLILGFVLISLRSVDLTSYLESFIECVEGIGYWAPFFFILFYIITAGYILPVVLVTIVGGILFGVALGSLLVSIAFTLSSIIVYFVGRSYGDKLIPASVQSGNKFLAISKVLKDEGFKFVFLLRFVPILSSITLNLTCGMVKIKPKEFILATFIAQLPGTIIYTYLGSMTKDISTAQQDMAQKATTEWVMLAIGIIATIAVIIFAKVKVKQALKKIENKH